MTKHNRYACCNWLITTKYEEVRNFTAWNQTIQIFHISLHRTLRQGGWNFMWYIYRKILPKCSMFYMDVFNTRSGSGMEGLAELTGAHMKTWASHIFQIASILSQPTKLLFCGAHFFYCIFEPTGWEYVLIMKTCELLSSDCKRLLYDLHLVGMN